MKIGRSFIVDIGCDGEKYKKTGPSHEKVIFSLQCPILNILYVVAHMNESNMPSLVFIKNRYVLSATKILILPQLFLNLLKHVYRALQNQIGLVYYTMALSI